MARPLLISGTAEITSVTRCGSTIYVNIFRLSDAHELKGYQCRPTSSGRCWITSSGRKATASASVSSTSTTPHSAASSKTAVTGMRPLSRHNVGNRACELKFALLFSPSHSLVFIEVLLKCAPNFRPCPVKQYSLILLGNTENVTDVF